ncbi:MAG: O-antigen ligase domain-containing protein [Bacteroidetes bacterium]|nr:O-antigen ligase domain-containing protein [Bacteroidota bacterium]
MKRKYIEVKKELFRSPAFLIAFIATLVVCAYLISIGGILLAVAIFLLPFILTLLFYIIKNPTVGLITLVIASYLVMGIQKYLPSNIKMGLSIDVILLLTFIASFINIKTFKEKIKQVKTDLLLISLIWLAYNIIEIFNPLVSHSAAWFYGIRACCLYLIFIIILGSSWISSIKYLKKIIVIWGIFSILGTIKGVIQLYGGLDPFEQKWMDEGGYITHMIFNKLRVFSFYSDAGQFGAAQGHAAVVGLIMITSTKNWKQRLFFILMAAAGLYGMIISGTRGAVAIPFFGAFTYVLLRKNIYYIVLISTITIMGYLFLNHTYLGNRNFFIYRLRTAFDPNDPSFQVRVSNQKLYREYLRDKPFGVGVGSTGYIGNKFSPNTFAAKIPTDSFFVQIWVEQGIVGLILYIFMFIYFLSKSFYLIFFKIKTEELRIILIALVAGLFGVLIASYGNSVIGQLPLSIITFITLVFLFNSEQIEQDMIENKQQALKAGEDGK